MVKSSSKLALRKFTKNKFLLMGLSLLVIIGVAFFVLLFTISTRYGETTEQYFLEYAYADCTFYGSFDSDNLNLVKQQPGITLAESRYVKDYRNGDITFRAISLTENINKPYIYTGEMPANQTQCLILKKNADAMNIKLGDTVTIGEKNLKVSGLMASPEYIYLVKNDRSMMSDPNSFGVVYVNKDFFSGNFNEIVVKGLGFDNKQIEKNINKQNQQADGSYISGFEQAKSLLQSQQLNYTGYKADLDQIKSFSYIFPGVFALLILMVVYVVLKRTAVKERKQIAIYKALGAKNSQVIKIYLTQFIIAFSIAALIGCIITMFIVDIIINMFSSMFVMPLLSYHLYPYLWVGSIGVSLLLCIIPGILSLLDVLKMQPTEAMRPKTRKGGRKILIEKMPFLWNKFSFNTKHTLKSMFRSKARFFAVFLGIAGTCALLTLSFGFNNSIQNTRNAYFNEFAKYDLIANFDQLPLEEQDKSIDVLSSDDEYAKALQFPVNIKDTDCIVTVVASDFNFLNLDSGKLKSGIIIPEYYAKQWKVKEGESVSIEGYTYKISAVITQTMALSLYTSYEYIANINAGFLSVYNTIYVRGQNLENLTGYLNANEILYSTIEDDTATFRSVSQTLDMLIYIMLICALVLGIAVLYTVGLMNLSARENEYMLMSTMGYGRKKIMLTYIKEILIQILFAMPIGFLFGNLLIYAIQGQFSNSSFVVKATVYPLSYLLSIGIVLLIGTIIYFVTDRQIKKLDIVEGLKAQDD